MTIERYDRQSFLGSDAQTIFENAIIGVTGLGGGGSHIVQQLAHIGFRRYRLFDGDVTEETNLNRLVGAVPADALAETPKLLISKRMIYTLQPQAEVEGFSCRWQDNADALKDCHIVLGSVDSLNDRAELEVLCRRYLMHYIDIGMDVHGITHPVIGGQVIQSSPGGPCLRCMGFLTDKDLADEAAQYGNAGKRPQVIWSNGILASTAVGIAVDLLTGWTGKSPTHNYLVYDGNKGTLTESLTLRDLSGKECQHFSPAQIGDPL